MQKNILLIGGTRFFGKLLVQRLLNAGHSVTIATRGLAADPFRERVTRIRVDRRNEAAMRAAFANVAGYDIVYDQVCYNPVDAAISVKVFAGKAKRYVMASTIEVYRALLGHQDQAFAESDWNVMAQPVDVHYPWQNASCTDQSYALGKRQAEAYFYRDGSLPVVSVRLGHVLGGPEDFTRRLAGYVDLARQNAALRYSSESGASSFISAQAAADFMVWAGEQSFVGPVNAASDGTLSAHDLYHRIGRVLDTSVGTLPVSSVLPAGSLGPFDYFAPFVLDTARAYDHGYRFSHIDDWLDDVIRMHDLEFA